METSERRAIALAMVVGLALFNQPARADGLPRPGVYPVPQQGSPSCLMTALQMGYLTGRRELAYVNTEACLIFVGSRGAALPYGFAGPYVPPGWIPPGWIVPPRRSYR